ncbi:TlpA disulfide reductase family protein [Singulisphaera sp. Ch08]|uniref:TlpA disulfide reductase family protein n=1 Tax=Singulisphaera sp. Ch08 TaxID=3120278 RepID=A0AAU7CM68_9BACT
MRIMLFGILAFFPFLGAIAADRPDQLEHQFNNLKSEYGAAQQDLRQAMARAGEGDERKAVLKQHQERKKELGTRALKLAQAAPKTPVTIDVLTWIVSLRTPSLTAEASKILVRDYINSDDILKACLYASRSQGPDFALVEGFLREVMVKSQNRRVKGLTTFYLAGFLKDRAEFVRSLKENSKVLEWHRETYGVKEVEQSLARAPNDLAKESEQLFEKIVEDYADLMTQSGDRLGTRAKGELFEARNLSVGKVAPEIEGQDVDGVRFKLSDYRGRVVLLTFSGTWCGPCRAMYSEERSLVERLKDKPFAVLSFNAEEEAEPLRKAIKSREITWRCWYEHGPNGPGSGPVCMRMGINAFPSMFILDRSGVIRYKEIHGDKLEEAVNKLLKEIDAGNH